MLEFEPQYPRIALAVRLISAEGDDHHSAGLGIASLTTLIERRLRAAVGGLGVEELEEIETYLGDLSREELGTLCAGKQWEEEGLSAPPIVQGFLQRAIEGLVRA